MREVELIGPPGRVMVSEDEAKRRIALGGWQRMSDFMAERKAKAEKAKPKAKPKKASKKATPKPSEDPDDKRFASLGDPEE